MRHHIRLHQVTPDDVPGIASLIASLGYPVHDDALCHVLALLHESPDHAVVVAEAAGQVSGLLVLSSRPSLTLQGRVGIVQELVVRPSQRRREIGESLLQYAKALAVERAFARLECVAPPALQPAAGHFLLERAFEAAEATTYRWSVLESGRPRSTAPHGVRRLRPAPA